MKTTGAIEQKGFDAGKKRVKRQIVTEDIGCLLYVLIHKANQHDTKMGYWVACLSTFAYPTLQKICGDDGYRCSFVYEAYKYFGLRVEISKKLKGGGWQVLAKRWIVDALFLGLITLADLARIMS